MKKILLLFMLCFAAIQFQANAQSGMSDKEKKEAAKEAAEAKKDALKEKEDAAKLAAEEKSQERLEEKDTPKDLLNQFLKE